MGKNRLEAFSGGVNSLIIMCSASSASDLLELASICESPDKREKVMPMMPGPLAAVTYVAVKITGYAGFAYGLNRMLGRNTRVWKFGVAKTGIGLVGGFIYLFVILKVIESNELTEAQALAGALPIRLMAWGLALALFYGFRDRLKMVVLALVAGVIWSYALDGMMAILYQLPGMAMPIC